MIKTILCIFLLAFCAQAGVLRTISYPFRVSPVKLFMPVFKVISFPVRHPVKTMKPLVFPIVHPKRFFVEAAPVATPIFRLASITLVPAFHGPTLPPNPWDGVLIRVEGAF